MNIEAIVLMLVITAFLYGLIIFVQRVIKEPKDMDIVYVVTYVILVMTSIYSIVISLLNKENIADETILLLVLTGMQSMKEINLFCEKRKGASKMESQKKIIILIIVIAIGAIVLSPVLTMGILKLMENLLGITNNYWVGYFGNYFGAILGGVLSGLVAIIIMLTTIRNQRKEEKIKVVTRQLNKLAEKNAELLEHIEAAAYSAIESVNRKDETNPIDIMKKYLKDKRRARTAALVIYQEMEIMLEDI